MPVIDSGPASGDGSGGPCTAWAGVEDVCAPCNDYDFDADLLDDALLMATEVLWNLTGRRWSGTCTDLVRPTSCGCRDGYPGLWLPPGIRYGTVGLGCACGCDGVSELRLPNYPVQAITEVLIDGEPVDPADYRVDNHRRLVWQGTDGRGGWPCCQRLDLPAGEPGTWSVEYTFGALPPRGGVKAAASLGCQLALACSPELAGQCRLPKRVTSITRQGVTLAVLDPLALFSDGLTGLAEVDLWVQATLKGDARRRATAWVPGRRGKARRRTDG